MSRTVVASWIVPASGSKRSWTENWSTQHICISVSDPHVFWCAGGLWRSAANHLNSAAHGSAEEGPGTSENRPGELLLRNRNTDVG